MGGVAPQCLDARPALPPPSSPKWDATHAPRPRVLDRPRQGTSAGAAASPRTNSLRVPPRASPRSLQRRLNSEGVADWPPPSAQSRIGA
ncbi:hypothetical protein GGTG_12434 [Gaeumannomyces tritici R3-111a-1]|uniref:Uncharacterized protein n=1 Tax=Gaeumannomyces tritici (strain R3-111a-1) TaxID=644352 RepID=J3PG08_GAET3|nr:hypothetical protein GGTG_12434 [Gaeumannomyces tritici R3-111a-1]EJT70261.1 hypothetical protein GGTG_12434 [Gaeumannomyces tritici R3-111a-1]